VAADRDGHPVGVSGVLDRVGDELASQQFGVEGSRMTVEQIPDEPVRG
jgi:hypothetical protein